jgi:hypothetical protein
VAAASVAEAFTAAASVVAVFEVEGFTAVLPVEAFEVGVFAAVAFAAVALAIILMVTDTAALAALAILMVTDTAALPAAVFVAAAFVAVGDPYNQSVYQGSARYIDQLVGQMQLCLARGRLLL